MYVLSIHVRPCDLRGLHEFSTNGLYDLSINGMYVLFINVRPCDVCDMHELSVNGIHVPTFHVFSRDIGESMDVISESGLNGLNGLNGIDLE